MQRQNEDIKVILEEHIKSDAANGMTLPDGNITDKLRHFLLGNREKRELMNKLKEDISSRDRKLLEYENQIQALQAEIGKWKVQRECNVRNSFLKIFFHLVLSGGS